MRIGLLELVSLMLLAGSGGFVAHALSSRKPLPATASTSASLCSMATEYELRPVSEVSPSVRIRRNLFRNDGWAVVGANLDAHTYPTADSAFEAYQGTLQVQTDGGSRD